MQSSDATSCHLMRFITILTHWVFAVGEGVGEGVGTWLYGLPLEGVSKGSSLASALKEKAKIYGNTLARLT